MNIQESLPERLKRRMGAMNLSQAELARRAGLSPAYISMLLSGQRGGSIRMDAAKCLADALDVSLLFFANPSSLKGMHVAEPSGDK